MAKFERILSLFPAYYGATEPTKLIYEVVRQLAQPLEEADTHLFRIQRAHRLRVAEHAQDILRLAGALNLTPFHFEDLMADEGMEYGKKLKLMRERVQRIARVHLQGLGTPWAVMECAAIFLNAVIVGERAGDPLMKHLDREMFSHKSILEFAHLAEKPRERIYLHENPYRRRKVDPAERWPMNSWAVENQNMEESRLKLAIQGMGDRTVLPSIFCPQTQEGIQFNGLVPGGKTLVIDEAGGALLDQKPVDEWMVHYQGGIFDFSHLEGGSFSRERGGTSPPFDGDLEKIISRPIRIKRPVPTVPTGRSEWYFKVAEGLYDGNDYDFSVYGPEPEPIGFYDGDFDFDGCVFDFPGSGVIGMAWDERIPCSFKLLLPANVPRAQDQTAAPPAKEAGEPMDDVGRIGNILPRFKAAGIRSFVDRARDAWILGESVIRRSTETEGKGVEFHATRLKDQNTDIWVPLDTNA